MPAYPGKVTLLRALVLAGMLATLAFPHNPGQTANDHPVRFFGAEISGGVNFERLALRGAVVSLAPIGASGAETTDTDERGAFVFHRSLVQHQRYELTVRCQSFRTFSKVIDADAGFLDCRHLQSDQRQAERERRTRSGDHFTTQRFAALPEQTFVRASLHTFP